MSETDPNLRSVRAADIEATVQAWRSGFAEDPLITFLFGPGWAQRAHAAEFFRILLEARVALHMPAVCAEQDGQVLGGIMGYDVTRPAWPEHQVARWQALLHDADGFATRLADYQGLADQFEPAQPHFYLGVIGVRAGLQGRGIGRRLLHHFCSASDQDPDSRGTYLETASADSLAFYRAHGFAVLGQGTLGGHTPLWCVFRPSTPGGS